MTTAIGDRGCACVCLPVDDYPVAGDPEQAGSPERALALDVLVVHLA